MNIEISDVIVYTALNPNGIRAKEGKYVDEREGGLYNGYVAIPSELAQFIESSEDEWNFSYGYDLPSVSGGCTYCRTAYSDELLQRFKDKEDVELAKDLPTELADSYKVFGFDTCHYNDCRSEWPRHKVAEEALEWAEKIVKIIKEAQAEADTQGAKMALEALCDNIKDDSVSQFTIWSISQMTGYIPQTKFWEAFSTADLAVLSGINNEAVVNAHKRAWERLKTLEFGIEALTEYIMVLNWKIWQHYIESDPLRMELARLYDSLWKEADLWAMDNLKDADLDYYILTTD